MTTPAAAPRRSTPEPRPSRLALARARHRSPLRRTTDRWRSVVVRLQLFAAMAAALLSALLGVSVYQQEHVQSVQQAQHLRLVQAELVSPPYADGVGGDLAQVRWTGTDGKTHEGSSHVPASDRAGDRARIWLDAQSNPAAAPASEHNVVGAAVLTGLLAALGAWGVVLAVGAFAKARLDRRDEEAWEFEWQMFEPLWTRRR